MCLFDFGLICVQIPYNLRIYHSIVGNPPAFNEAYSVLWLNNQMVFQGTYENTLQYGELHDMWYSLCSSFFFRISCCSFSLFSSSISLCLCSTLYWEEKKKGEQLISLLKLHMYIYKYCTEKRQTLLLSYFLTIKTPIPLHGWILPLDLHIKWDLLKCWTNKI